MGEPRADLLPYPSPIRTASAPVLAVFASVAIIAIVNEPLAPATAKALANQALAAGRIILDDHVRQRMAQHKITLVEVYRVLRAGAPQQGELDRGTFRYPLTTPSITVCYAFRRWKPITISIVTVLRHR